MTLRYTPRVRRAKSGTVSLKVKYMGRLVLWIIVAIVVIVIAGAVYLMTADVPAPVHHVEQVIPNDQLGR